MFINSTTELCMSRIAIPVRFTRIRPCRPAAPLILMLTLLSATVSFGMTDLYQLAQRTGSGTDMTGSTQVFGPNASYTSSTTTYPIGFTFVYDRTPYTTFSVNTSGLMSLGRATYPYPYSYYWPNYSLTSYHPLLTAYWCYYGAPTSAGKVHYKVTGTAPNRVLTVEWLNVHLVNSTSYSGGTWQIRLYEGSNRIEFWYGPFYGRNDYYYWPIGITSSDTRYINVWGNNVTSQYYLYPSGQYFTYRYVEYYPISQNTIFEFSSCDKGLTGLVGNTADGGTSAMKNGDTLLMNKKVMRGNTTGFRPFSFDMPANPCGQWTYSVSFSGPAAGDYAISPGNGTIVTEGLAPTVNFTPGGVGVRHATMTVSLTNGETFTYPLKAEGLSRMGRVGNVAEGGTTGMNDKDQLLTNIDVPRGTSRDLRPFRINNINTAPTNNTLRNATVTFRLDDPYDQYAIRLETTASAGKGASVQSITTVSAVLAPGGSVTPVITFSPNPNGSEQGTGPQPATLTVTADGEVFVYTLNGYSVAPVAEFYFRDQRLIGSSKRLFVNEVTCVGEEFTTGTFVVDNINKVPVTIDGIDVFLTESEVRQGAPPYDQKLDAFGQLVPVLDYFLSTNPTVAPYKANAVVRFPVTIQPGQRQTFHLGFVSQRPGKRFARLFLHTNAVNFRGMEVEGYMPNAGATAETEGVMVLDLFGYGRGSHLAKNAEGDLTGLSMVFDPVKVASSNVAETWVHNTGDCDLRISREDIRLVAGDVSDFELLDVLPNTIVDARGDFILPPGGSDRITASFTPSRSGSRRASVMLRTNDSSLVVDGVTERGMYFLDFYGVGQAYLEARSIRLAPAVIDGPSAKGSVIVINASTETMEITAATINGPDAGEMSPDPTRPWPTLPLTIRPGEKALFAVVHTPAPGSTPGPRNATIDFTLRNGDPVTAQITGLAGTRTLVANPVSMFRTGPVEVGTVRREYAVLTNAGTFPVHIDRIGIIGTGAADYRLTVSGRLDLDPGESQFIEVTYAPTAPGDSPAQIEIVSNATNGTQLIDLGGTATGTGTIVTPSHGTVIGNRSAARSVAASGATVASIAPNPASGQVTIGYTLATDGPTDVALYDLSGRLVRTLQTGFRESGEHTARADVSDLANGTYYITIRREGIVARRAFVVAR